VRRFACRVAAVVTASLALVACSSSYHPEYHPQSATTYVQNVTYAHNVSYGGSADAPAAISYPAGVDVAMAGPYLFTGATSTANAPGPGAPPPGQAHRVGTVASPGAVVVYGNVNGNIILGR
jgi:hypothetical protein